MNTALYTDRELFIQIAAGDEKSFRVLYDKYWHNIYGMSLTYTKSVAEAQDMVQEVFLRVWEKRATLAGVETPAGFLFTLARNLVISALRKKAVRALAQSTDQQEEDSLLPDNFLLPDAQIILKQSETAIDKAITRLTPQQQQIFLLSRKEGLSHEEISQRLGINRYTVKNHIVAALHTLRQQLSKEQILVLLPLFILSGEKL
ncbi:MAG: RNA polymerase sigma-70 factor [Chitinophagaceae bacterium]|nr:RNA polymerase sigma-70 factor [Chitinophagaceae bacterium]